MKNYVKQTAIQDSVIQNCSEKMLIWSGKHYLVH